MDKKMLAYRAGTGDQEALIQLVMAQKEDYYRLAYTYMGNKDDALDAVSDMIVILYGHIQGLRNPDSFYSWSKTILVNRCKKLLKLKRKMLPMERVPMVSSVESMTDNDTRFDVERSLEKLSAPQREAIRLRYFLGLDYRTIARVTKVPQGTVKSRISSGLKRLKAIFGGDY